MTPYEQGFINKCAEYNVNPEALVKQAGLMDILRRYGTLLTGSEASALGSKAQNLRNIVSKAMGTLEEQSAASPEVKNFLEQLVINPARTRYPGVTGLADVPIQSLNRSLGHIDDLFKHYEGKGNELPEVFSQLKGSLPMNDVRAAAEMTDKAITERLKSLGTQVGTGTGALGLGGLGYGMYSDMKDQAQRLG